MSFFEPLAEWELVATYPTNGNSFPQPDRSRAGDARTRPTLDPVLQDLHEVSDQVVEANAGASVDATMGVPAYVTTLDAQGHYLRTPITPNQSDGILDVAGASTLFASTSHAHDGADITAARLLGRGTAAGAGPAQEITVGDLLSLSGSTLSATQQDAFRAILVDGQDTVYAGGADGFTLIAGNGVRLTTDAVNRTITIDLTNE